MPRDGSTEAPAAPSARGGDRAAETPSGERAIFDAPPKAVAPAREDAPATGLGEAAFSSSPVGKAPLAAARRARAIAPASPNDVTPEPAKRRGRPPKRSAQADAADRGRAWRDAHPDDASVGGPTSQREPTLDELIASLVALYRVRQDLVTAKVPLDLRMHATCRRIVGMAPGQASEDGKLAAARDLYDRAEAWLDSEGDQQPEPDAMMAALTMRPILAARSELVREIAAIDRQLSRMVEGLPGFAFVEGTRGFGAVTFAAILGECRHPLHSYSSVSAIWKRLGLAVRDGAAAKSPDPTEDGYSGRRRAITFLLAQGLIKAQRAGDPYRDAYDAYKARITAANEAGAYAERAAALLDRGLKAGAAQRKTWSEGKLTKGHINDMSMRWLAKRAVRDLVREWRRDVAAHWPGAPIADIGPPHEDDGMAMAA